MEGRNVQFCFPLQIDKISSELKGKPTAQNKVYKILFTLLIMANEVLLTLTGSKTSALCNSQHLFHPKLQTP